MLFFNSSPLFPPPPPSLYLSVALFPPPVRGLNSSDSPTLLFVFIRKAVDHNAFVAEQWKIVSTAVYVCDCGIRSCRNIKILGPYLKSFAIAISYIFNSFASFQYRFFLATILNIQTICYLSERNFYIFYPFEKFLFPILQLYFFRT